MYTLRRDLKLKSFTLSKEHLPRSGSSIHALLGEAMSVHFDGPFFYPKNIQSTPCFKLTETLECERVQLHSASLAKFFVPPPCQYKDSSDKSLDVAWWEPLKLIVEWCTALKCFTYVNNKTFFSSHNTNHNVTNQVYIIMKKLLNVTFVQGNCGLV